MDKNGARTKVIKWPYTRETKGARAHWDKKWPKQEKQKKALEGGQKGPEQLRDQKLNKGDNWGLSKVDRKCLSKEDKKV